MLVDTDVELLSVEHAGDVALVAHAADRGEDRPVGVERGSLPASVRPQHVLGHDQPAAPDFEVVHPRRPDVIDGVHQVDDVCRQVGAAEVFQCRGVSPLRRGPMVRHVACGEFVDTEWHDVGEGGCRRVCGEVDLGAELGPRTPVEAVEDDAALVPFEVPPHDPVVIRRQLGPERDGGELAPGELWDGAVGVDPVDPRMLVDGLIPHDSPVHPAERARGLGGHQET